MCCYFEISEKYFVISNIVVIFALGKDPDMRIFTEQTIKQFVEQHPESLVAMQVWVSVVKGSRWNCFADVKRDFNSVDAVGNQRYVFDIMGNHFRIVAVIKFTIGFVYVRFVGTHKEYDKIDCKTI